ncbi:MAG: hypothetical protein GY697_09470 [Desulfobacterales bacterium]|nr:hypothetical protein [Desulfobacterales bacterium]
MHGAIPYYKIQTRRAYHEAKRTFSSPGSMGGVPILLCDMAHHVNNLLMRIQGYTSLMLMDVQAGQTGYERLKQMETYIAYGAMLTSQLLACAGRGVYADPVNIPPLLLETPGAHGSVFAEDTISARLFIIGYEKDQIRPGLLGICRDISLKMTGLFTGIESVMMKGRHNQIEKGYLDRVRRATADGARIAQGVSAVLGRSQSPPPVHRPPAGLRVRAHVPPVKSTGFIQ